MRLDHTQGCVNFRDIGSWVNLIAACPWLLERRLLRGGKLDFMQSAADIGHPGTIINLRKGGDRCTFGARAYHCPISNKYEKYDTRQPEVRRWLSSVVHLFEDASLRYPVLIHCTSGKDRTGVAAAALLRILGIPDAVIVEEYLLSDGDVKESWIRYALDGIGDPERYFTRVDLQRVCAHIHAGRPGDKRP